MDVEFTRDFQLMWPASIGTSYGEWNEAGKAFYFGADGQPFAAVLGSPDAAFVEREYGANYSTGDQQPLHAWDRSRCRAHRCSPWRDR